jgi:uncharacterized membrane protein affecting hemolysin expression
MPWLSVMSCTYQVLQAMNQIEAQRRMRMAAQEKAEVLTTQLAPSVSSLLSSGPSGAVGSLLWAECQGQSARG